MCTMFHIYLLLLSGEHCWGFMDRAAILIIQFDFILILIQELIGILVDESAVILICCTQLVSSHKPKKLLSIGALVIIGGNSSIYEKDDVKKSKYDKLTMKFISETQLMFNKFTA